LFRWNAELEAGCSPAHDLLLIADARCSQETTAEIALAAGATFASVTVLPFTDHFRKWPEAPNATFSFAARHIMAHQNAPWLLLEPDCCPLKAGWRDAIWQEYSGQSKPFLGDFVHVDQPDFIDHMSGVAVYPANMIEAAGLALISSEIAWDVAAAAQIVPQMTRSKLILHSWNHAPFESWDAVEREIFAVKPECVLFHASKDGSLIDRMREHFANTEPRPVSTSLAVAKRVEASEGPERTGNKPLMRNPRADGPSRQAVLPATPFTCDIFLKTFPADYPWAEYCLRSIDKFCTGFRRVVIVAPDPGCPTPEDTPHEVVIVPEQDNGYNGQQVVKLTADEYSDADFILFADSDTIFTRPVTPETFLRDGKPIWLMTPFENARADQRDAWLPVMTRWMGEVPQFEWMRRHPFIFPRWLFESVRQFCAEKHGRTIEQYVMEQGPGLSFSEFNCAGFLAYQHHRDKFAWINTVTDRVPPETTLQKWSRGGLTDEIRAEFETILNVPDGYRLNPAWLSASHFVETPGLLPQPRKVETILSGHGEQQPHGPNVDPLPAQTLSRQELEAEWRKAGAGAVFAMPDFGPTPWQSKEQSIAEIKSLSERLKKFCGMAAHTRIVRHELHKLGVIDLPYRFKRRKSKWRKRKAKP
jgi:hypothetical protein